MSDADRMALKPGDRVLVLVRTDAGTVLEFEVKFAPWVLGGGTWVVGLAGIAGGYLLSRVEGLVHHTPVPEARP